MPRISSNRPAPKATATTEVKASITKQLKSTAEKLVKGNKLEFGKLPEGVKFVRVPLSKGKTDQYSYTALIPVNSKSKDPNKADGFFLERSGGLAGLKQAAGPFTFEGKKLGKTSPFFEKFLEGQNKPSKPGNVVTEMFPSDQESVDKPNKPIGTVHTMAWPSDHEMVDRPTKPGTIVTERYPSDNETIDKPVKPNPGTVVTERYPSDNESIDKPVKPGGNVFTERYPSDNEDGNVR